MYTLLNICRYKEAMDLRPLCTRFLTKRNRSFVYVYERATSQLLTQELLRDEREDEEQPSKQ